MVRVEKLVKYTKKGEKINELVRHIAKNAKKRKTRIGVNSYKEILQDQEPTIKYNIDLSGNKSISSKEISKTKKIKQYIKQRELKREERKQKREQQKKENELLEKALLQPRELKLQPQLHNIIDSSKNVMQPIISDNPEQIYTPSTPIPDMQLLLQPQSQPQPQPQPQPQSEPQPNEYASDSLLKDSDYVIAIPSYNRPDKIQQNTLAVLKKHNINPTHITIFVANQDQYNIYKNAIPANLYNNIVIGLETLKNQRNFINDYYPEGKHIVEMDDDIKSIVQLIITEKSGKSLKSLVASHMEKAGMSRTGGKSGMSGKAKSKKKIYKFTKPIADLDGFIKNAFKICANENIYLWGVYPLANPYYMTDKITKDLRFIVGPMWGMINRHRSDLKLTVDEKENSERTLQHWVADGAVLRFNNVAIATNYYKNKGGMQSEGKDRKQEALKSVYYLHQLYPDLTTISLTKKSGMAEIKLIRQKGKK